MDFSRALHGAAAGAVAVFLLCAADASSGTPAVSVVAIYRERIALPAGAALTVRLVDASDSGFAAPPLATATLLNPHVPVSLNLAYDPSNVDSSRAYGVSARIVSDGEVWFATSSPVHVITLGNPTHADVLLERVTGDSPANLEERRWMLSEMSGHFFAGARVPYIDLAGGHLSGSGGCNHFAGTYKLNGNSVAFNAGALTMAACLQKEVEDNETAFLRNLQYVRYWNVSGIRLELLDAGHKPVLAFIDSSAQM